MSFSSLHVETSGAGPAVILLHSSGLSGRQWRRLAGRVAGEGFRAVVPDLSGHGASPAWPEGQAFSYRDDVAVLVAALRSEPAHVVGHSYGGLVAALAAVEVPERVLSLALYEPVAFGVLDRVADADALADIDRVAVPWGESEAEHEVWLRSFVDYWGGTGAWAALREEARAEFRRVGWVLKEGVVTLAEDRTPAAAYADVQGPATLMTGELSPIAAGRVVARLAMALPHAQRVVLPGVGHMAPLAQADKVNDLVVEHLRRGTPD